jgi:hypothetical protein
VRRVEHFGALALTEIIVRAPNDDVALATVLTPDRRVRETPTLAHDVREHPIAPFVANCRNGGFEDLFVLSSHDFGPFARLAHATDL